MKNTDRLGLLFIAISLHSYFDFSLADFLVFLVGSIFILYGMDKEQK